ncbi:hypothetical protein SLS54_008075 [Diplodia seriata]
MALFLEKKNNVTAMGKSAWEALTENQASATALITTMEEQGVSAEAIELARGIADGAKAAIDTMDKARKEAERNMFQTARNIADVAALHGDKLTDAKIKEVLEMGANLTTKGTVSKALKEPRGWDGFNYL